MCPITRSQRAFPRDLGALSLGGRKLTDHKVDREEF